MSAAVLPAPASRTAPARPDPYADGEGRFEVVRGVRVEKQPMGLVENLIASILQGRLEPFCRENGLGRAVNETMFTLPVGGNDRKPDVAFVSHARWAADRPIPRVNAWPVAPDLAVEVVSPTDKAFDVVDKLREYFAAGVRQVWHVYSNVEQVFVFDSPTAVRILTGGDELSGDPVVPGFRLPVADVFPLAEPAP
ncbi:MAG: Uma2 family endonuclease [Isosphaera sp.]|nr:Uma2 family endonuclease [Isosphaera sp.]